MRVCLGAWGGECCVVCCLLCFLGGRDRRYTPLLASSPRIDHSLKPPPRTPNSHPRFLPKARLRVLALEALLALTRLPYAKLHPYRAQVSRGLLAPLDDKKRLVRQMAVRVRNEWMVMDR